jgi:peptidoglycan/LPS O-acetylase OafA/YrhL
MDFEVFKEREIGYDFLRLLAIFLIFLSHELYVGSDPVAQSLRLMLGILGNGTFFFISGYLIYLNNNQIKTVNDVKKFYVKRIKRIYPLYWVACFIWLILMYLQNDFNDLNIITFIITLLGLQMVFYPEFISISGLFLWFIGIIVVYYLLYPIIILYSSGEPKRIFYYSLLFLIPLLLLKIFWGLFGGGIFEFYFVFVVGILVASTKFFDNNFYKKYWMISLILFLILFPIVILNYIEIEGFERLSNISFQMVLNTAGTFAIRILVIFTFILSIFEIFRDFFPKSKRFLRIVTMGAIGSYALYLFHSFLHINRWFNKEFNLYIINLLIVFIIFPVLIIICYYIQILSDQLLFSKRSG